MTRYPKRKASNANPPLDFDTKLNAAIKKISEGLSNEWETVLDYIHLQAQMPPMMRSELSIEQRALIAANKEGITQILYRLSRGD